MTERLKKRTWYRVYFSITITKAGYVPKKVFFYFFIVLKLLQNR